MADLPTDFDARVRAARAYADVASQAKFGKLIGVSGTTIKNYESGATKPDERASAETVKRLAKATKLPEWFFTIGRLDSMRLGAGGPSTDERLVEILKVLGELRERLPEKDEQIATIHEAFEDYASRLGPRIGKRPPRSQRARGPSPESPSAAAAGS